MSKVVPIGFPLSLILLSPCMKCGLPQRRFIGASTAIPNLRGRFLDDPCHQLSSEHPSAITGWCADRSLVGAPPEPYQAHRVGYLGYPGRVGFSHPMTQVGGSYLPTRVGEPIRLRTDSFPKLKVGPDVWSQT
jgi:hypothetical protein